VTKMGRPRHSHPEIAEKAVPEYPKPVLAFR